MFHRLSRNKWSLSCISCSKRQGLATSLPGKMADDKDSLPKLKDLVFLKNQLEKKKKKKKKNQLECLQQRVEEVSSGVSQEGSLLSSPFLKGFLAGYVVAKLRASAVLGFAVGTCTGIYAAQAYAVPNVEKTLRDYLQSLRKGSD
ncbi:SLC35A4 upstream open reading frame protein-like [Canis lupus baileyi]|uniref:SLC35A4 upstream open reading frame protein-like n=1 Tax=Canis lupus baileyi TaxID=143281 RepID=UPI003B97AE1C